MSPISNERHWFKHWEVKSFTLPQKSRRDDITSPIYSTRTVSGFHLTWYQLVHKMLTIRIAHAVPCVNPGQKKKFSSMKFILGDIVKKNITNSRAPELTCFIIKNGVQVSIATNHCIGGRIVNMTVGILKAKEWWNRRLWSLAATPLQFLESTTQVLVFGKTQRGNMMYHVCRRCGLKAVKVLHFL